MLGTLRHRPTETSSEVAGKFYVGSLLNADQQTVVLGT
jgi:hypothetical protein